MMPLRSAAAAASRIRPMFIPPTATMADSALADSAMADSALAEAPTMDLSGGLEQADAPWWAHPSVQKYVQFFPVFVMLIMQIYFHARGPVKGKKKTPKEAADATDPTVFFDITIGGEPVGRIESEPEPLHARHPSALGIVHSSAIGHTTPYARPLPRPQCRSSPRCAPGRPLTSGHCAPARKAWVRRASRSTSRGVASTE